MSTGTRPKIPSGQRISTLDYRLIEAAGGTIETAVLLKHAAPSLLAALALDANTPAALKLSTAEAAAQYPEMRAARPFSDLGAFPVSGPLLRAVARALAASHHLECPPAHRRRD